MELVISGEAMEDSGDLPSDPEVLQAVIDSADEEIRDLEAQIAREEDKHQKYKVCGQRLTTLHMRMCSYPISNVTYIRTYLIL